MHPQHVHIIKESESGFTVKQIAKGVMGISNTRFSRMKYNAGVLLDGQIAYANDTVKPGQRLTLVEKEAASYKPIAYNRTVPILFEDEHLYIVDKPAPMACQAGAHQTGDTLENAMYAYFNQPADFIFRPINRLDKGTSGLLAVAKSGHVHSLMQKQLHTKTYQRTYLAVTENTLPQEEGVIMLPIGREDGSIVKRCVREDGRDATTAYKVLMRKNNRMLIQLNLKTGRTHQIRVHLSALGCPVCGDYLYGMELDTLQRRFALHSNIISFLHPITGETIVKEAPLPKELLALLGK